MPISRRLLTSALAVAMLTLLPTAAFAYAPTGDDFITCVDGEDGEVDCVAGVFDENTDCTFETSTGESGTATSDDEGEVSFSFDAPEEEGADVTVTVRCGDKILSDTIENLNAEDDAVDEGDLADTGAESLGIVGLGLGALLIGGGILAFSRRRTTADA